MTQGTISSGAKNESKDFESLEPSPVANTKRYNLYTSVPKSRQIIVNSQQGYGCVSLIMDEDVSIKCASKFGPLWEAQPNNLTNLLSSSFGLPSGQFALQGAQIWQSTEPLKLSFSGTKYMNKDPYDDVVVPMSSLTKLCLPELGDTNNMSSVSMALESIAESVLGIKLQTLIPPGPNIQTLLTLMSDGVNGGLASLIKKRTNTGNKVRGLMEIWMGNFYFPDGIIVSANPTFSKEIAYSESAKGYFPISANISIEFNTMQVATVGYMDRTFSAGKSSGANSTTSVNATATTVTQ